MKKNYPSTDRDKMVVAYTYYILAQHKGKRNRITRKQLCGEVDGAVFCYGTIEDRDVRNAIEYLRNTAQGSLILSTSGSSGYWMAESLEEFMDCINEDRRRALSILIRIHKQKKAAKKWFVEKLPLFEFVGME